MELLRVANLRKVYGAGNLAVTALDDITFSAQTGELVALLGPSGSGKSSLLFCISLILEPTAGFIAVNGTTIYENGWTGVDTRRFRRENIGFIFQAKNLIPFLNATENVALAMVLDGVKAREARSRARELLAYLDVAHRANAMPAELSGGEQQRVAIARALANAPPLILADEPTASLDTERGNKVMEFLKRIAQERHSTVIVVTHDERMIQGFDAVYRLRDGRLTHDAAVAAPSPAPGITR
jgi:putative ABC transport system ATP-binding protein